MHVFSWSWKILNVIVGQARKMAAAGAGRLRRAASALLLRAPRLPARELSAPARLCHKKVVDHYENPRNVGSLDKTSKNVGTGLVGAPACGDVMKLQIQVDEKGKIVDARFKTFGCGSANASSSLATEWVKGKTVEEALTIKNTDIAKELCLPPVKLHCSSTCRLQHANRLGLGVGVVLGVFHNGIHVHLDRGMVSPLGSWNPPL